MRGEQQHREGSPVMTREMVDDNWILGQQPSPSATHSPLSSPTSYPPTSPLSTSLPPMSPLPHISGSTDQLAHRDITSSPAFPDFTHQLHHSSSSSPHHPAAAAAPACYHRQLEQEQTDMGSEGGTPNLTRRAGQNVTRVANEYASNVVSSQNPEPNMRAEDIRRTMKAAAIQHDVVCLSVCLSICLKWKMWEGVTG